MAIFLGGRKKQGCNRKGNKDVKYWEGKIFNLYHFFTVINICSGPVNEKDAALS